MASVGGAGFFAFFFVMNLVNPRWITFGDVRLSLVVGFGLAWVSWIALIEGLFYANLLAVVIGFGLIAAPRPSDVPPCPSACTSPSGRRSSSSPGRADRRAAAVQRPGGGNDARSRWRSSGRSCRLGPDPLLTSVVPVAGPSVSARPSSIARNSSPVSSTSRRTRPRTDASGGSGPRDPHDQAPAPDRVADHPDQLQKRRSLGADGVEHRVGTFGAGGTASAARSSMCTARMR